MLQSWKECISEVLGFQAAFWVCSLYWMIANFWGQQFVSTEKIKPGINTYFTLFEPLILQAKA